MRAMTVREFRARLAAVGDDELCCGTFWLAEDFLGINPDMTPDEIAAAMEYAEDHHDANEGFNWWHLEMAIDTVLLEGGGIALPEVQLQIL
jgi:hypothetical protein